MTCDSICEAMSALVDGEPPGLADTVISEHLDACAACRAWATATEDLVHTTRISATQPVPNLTADILMAAAQQGRPAVGGAQRRWRWALAMVAVAQLALTVPALVFGGHPGGHVHLAHEVGSWDVALAVGFLVVALRPARAWGMLPLVAAIVACLVFTTVVDVADGNAVHTRVVAHALQVAGLALLWVLAHRPALGRAPRLQAA